MKVCNGLAGSGGSTFRLVGCIAAGVLSLALSGCGGGGGGTTTTTPTPPTPPTTTVTPPAGVPQNGTNSVAATTASSAAWKALQPQVTVSSVTINSPPVVKFTVKDAAGNPVVGLGNKSLLTSTGQTVLTNIGFTLAKLVPGTNGEPSKWVNYLVFRPATATEKTATPATSACDAATNATWCGSYPTFDREGTLIDFGDGSYQYTFYRDPKQAATIVASLTDSADGLSKKADLGDLTWDPTATTRLGIQIGGNAPGTGNNYVDATTYASVSGGPAAVAMANPANYIYDFRPDGSAVASTRDIVTVDSCSECHAGKVLNHLARKDPNYCATCHTDQIKFSFDKEAPMSADGLTFAVQTGTNSQVRPNQAVVNGRAVGNLPNMIHHIHMGENLVKQGYHYNNDDLGLFNQVKFPQDVRNCTKCHDGSPTATHKTPDGNNWMNVPSRLACGACHDGIDFSTGKGVTLADAARGLTSSTYGHVGGAQSDDTNCHLCHKPGDIALYHIPVTPPNPTSALAVKGGSNYTNAAYIASNFNNLPAGAITVTYDIQSVSRDANKHPVMVFRLLQNGTPQPFADPTTATEIWPSFTGSPSLYWVFAVPQDGISAPADFNASESTYLKNLWNGKATGTGAGTLTGPDASGYYTATLTGSIVPDNAVMLTGGIGYDYSLSGTPPLTQTNVAGYPLSPSPVDPTKMVGGLIVPAPDVTKVATGYTGRRPIVETARCDKCHQTLGEFTKDAFHAGQRNDAASCSWCHNPNRASSAWSADSEYYIHAIHSADFRTQPFTWHAASPTDGFFNIGYPGVLQKCETCHLPGTYDFSAATSSSALPNRLFRTVATGTFNSATDTAGAISPYVTADGATSYGTGFSFSAATGVGTDASGSSLVISPIMTVCVSCHDGVSSSGIDVKLHMEQNGGAFYAARSTLYKSGTTALQNNETCMLCHASGGIADIAVMHAK